MTSVPLPTTPIFHALLGDLSDVPADYIRDVSHTKRALERWTMDSDFREVFDTRPQEALDELGVELRTEQVLALLPEGAQLAADPPESVHRYRAFIREKRGMRDTSRIEGEFKDRRLAIWRQRQIERGRGELGSSRAAAIVHAPMAIELSQGCTVGCWFCGVAAPKFEHWWPYTAENGAMWRDGLTGLHEILGDAIRHGFLYWATDPLDNPDYERFLVDFHATLGRCPQTTSAQGHRDPDRSRRLLELAYSMGSQVDRFSIVTMKSLRKLHDATTAEELLRVELVPQNKEAADRHPKAHAGRAWRASEKRRRELVGSGASSTIACVSGFLLNMVEGSVKLVTPCNANERWPLGYWVLGKRSFTSAAELCDGVSSLIDAHARVRLAPEDPVRLRPDLSVSVEDRDVVLGSLGHDARISDQPDTARLAQLLECGELSVMELAAERERAAGVQFVDTLSVLDAMFAGGLLDEEPEPPEVGTDASRPEAEVLAARGA